MEQTTDERIQARKFDAEYQEYVQMASKVNVAIYDYPQYLEHYADVSDQTCQELRAQLEQRDKTIAELHEDIARHSEQTVLIAKEAARLRRYAEQLRHERDMLEEQLGIPESLTVSKQEATTESEDVGEQPEKHALAREVATDMQWRGEPT